MTQFRNADRPLDYTPITRPRSAWSRYETVLSMLLVLVTVALLVSL